MAEKTTVYDVIRDRMIDTIDKEGTLPWARNWRLKNDLVGCGTDKNGRLITGPVNIISRAQYTGINIALLSGCSSPVFGTFKQWSGLGCTLKYQVDKNGNPLLDDHGKPIPPNRYVCVFYTKAKGKRMVQNKDGSESEKDVRYALLRYYGLYSIDDVNLTPAAERLMDRMRVSKDQVKTMVGNGTVTDYHTLVESITKKLDLTVKYGNPANVPHNSHIYMPDTDEYQDGTGYYYCQSFLHELSHWAGNPAQMDKASIKSNRPLEEMVAEIGSQMLLNVLCIRHDIDVATIDTDNSVAYVQGWRNRLKSEPNTINLLMKACSEAQKRSNYILGRLYPDDANLSGETQ